MKVITFYYAVYQWKIEIKGIVYFKIHASTRHGKTYLGRSTNEEGCFKNVGLTFSIEMMMILWRYLSFIL